MPRRRYRLFAVCAAVMTFLLWRVARNSWDSTDMLRQPLKIKDYLSHDIDVSGSKSPEPDIGGLTGTAAQEKEKAAKGKTPSESSVNTAAKNDPAADGTVTLDTGKSTGTKETVKTVDDDDDGDAVKSGSKGSKETTETGADEAEEEEEEEEEEEDIIDDSISSTNPPKGTTSISKSAMEDQVHWQPVKEHFPVPNSEAISLPFGTPKTLPQVQFEFTAESQSAKEKRIQRQDKVKTEIERAWGGYKKYAWTHDELRPVSAKFRDPFCGWAATLVDSLDTLYIAGMKDEFDEAVKAVADIDFTTTTRNDIPVFETTIRYLGGLLAAFDVSGGPKGDYPVLLEKATELAEILMGIFDTPNRMPVLYYNWKPEYASQSHAAGRVGIAELATLSLEFTRLAQITGLHKYYDAVARITNALVVFQEEQAQIPGLFPENLDASGCNRTATTLRDSLSENAKLLVDTSEDFLTPPQGWPESGAESSEKTPVKRHVPSLSKRKDTGGPFGANGEQSEWDCVHQGLVSSSPSMEVYHMAGSQDSAYEYFSKEYILLGGLEDKYKKLHIDTVDAITKHLLYRPMAEDGDDILFPARKSVFALRDEADLTYEITHLTCFIGGMYGLGGKIFGREKDLEIAKQLTDGCVWAYSSTSSGIMPESAEVLPCPTLSKCEFNQTLWYRELDPSADRRDEDVQRWKAEAKAEAKKKTKVILPPEADVDEEEEDEEEEDTDLGLNNALDNNELRDAQAEAKALKAAAAKGAPDAEILDKDQEAQLLMDAAEKGLPAAGKKTKGKSASSKAVSLDDADEEDESTLTGSKALIVDAADAADLESSKAKGKGKGKGAKTANTKAFEVEDETVFKSTKDYDQDASYKGAEENAASGSAADGKHSKGKDAYKIEIADAPKKDTMLDSKDPLVQAEAMERAKDALGEVDDATATNGGKKKSRTKRNQTPAFDAIENPAPDGMVKAPSKRDTTSPQTFAQARKEAAAQKAEEQRLAADKEKADAEAGKVALGASGSRQQTAQKTGSERPLTHEEFVQQRIKAEGLAPGFTTIRSRGYILRPEAIESVWYMYRITGDTTWQDKGWKMFEATIAATRTQYGHSAINDVTLSEPVLQDEMESFWLAETLKYYYLLFAEPGVISLDEWVLNTEAHPFKRPVS